MQDGVYTEEVLHYSTCIEEMARPLFMLMCSQLSMLPTIKQIMYWR